MKVRTAMVKLIPAICPQCGSKLKLPEGTTKTTCQFCGTEILLDKGEVVVIHKEDVEGKAARLLSVAEKYWDTWKFQEMRDACKQLLELDPDNPVGWLYNAISACGVGNNAEFERSMDEARKLSAKKMGSQQSNYFRQKVDWAYNNIANNILKYVATDDFGNAGVCAYMMVWMKPENPLGWWYRGYAISEQARAQAMAAAKKAGMPRGQASVTPAMVKEGRDAIAKAWQLYDQSPNDEFSKRFKEVAGKRFGAVRWTHIKSLIWTALVSAGSLVGAVLIAAISLGTLAICAGVAALFAILMAVLGISELWFLLTKNERNFI